jgi:hypothetical protein
MRSLVRIMLVSLLFLAGCSGNSDQDVTPTPEESPIVRGCEGPTSHLNVDDDGAVEGGERPLAGARGRAPD